MIKQFFIWLAMCSALVASAQSNNVSSSIDDQIMNEALGILNNISGYIFLEKGQTRKLSNTFNRTDKLFSGEDEKTLADEYSWEIQTNGIAKIDNDDGEIVGCNYGQTLLTVYPNANKNEKTYFVVFVCPTISMITPDGVVYTHQKIYKQQTKVDFTHSDNYVINSVMAKYDSDEDGNFEKYDITDLIDDKGHYVSPVQITSDVYYTVTLEQDIRNIVKSDSNFKLLVCDGEIRIAPRNSDSLSAADIEWFKTADVIASTPKNKGTTTEPNMVEVQVYNKKGADCMSLNEEHPRFNIPFNDGVYFITLKGADGRAYKYKIVVRYA